MVFGTEEPTYEQRAAAWSRCRQVAAQWADYHGVAFEMEQFERTRTWDMPETNAAGAVCAIGMAECNEVGVAWVVQVGRGSSDTPGATYQEITGRMGWVWSDRWRYWRGWFQSMTLASAARAQGGDSVRELFRHNETCDGEPHPGQDCPRHFH